MQAGAALNCYQLPQNQTLGSGLREATEEGFRKGSGGLVSTKDIKRAETPDIVLAKIQGTASGQP